MKTNRITPFAPGWLSFLVRASLCAKADADAARRRIAMAAAEEIERRRRRSRRHGRSDDNQ